MSDFDYCQMDKDNIIYIIKVISDYIRNKLFCLTHEFNPQVVCYIKVSMERKETEREMG